MTRPRHLNVSELFGPTIQGEGRHTGRLASFLRLAGCNLSCTWCDTPYTWDWGRYDRATEVRRRAVDELADQLGPLPGRLVVSGGEPLIQAPGLAELLRYLPARPVDLETNGTRPLGETEGMWDTITCSPKVGPTAGQDPALTRVHPSVLAAGADFKFVCGSAGDVQAVERWLEEHPEVDADRVWLMPEGTTSAELTRDQGVVAEAALCLGVNFTTRLHTLLWGNERGH